MGSWDYAYEDGHYSHGSGYPTQYTYPLSPLAEDMYLTSPVAATAPWNQELAGVTGPVAYSGFPCSVEYSTVYASNANSVHGGTTMRPTAIQVSTTIASSSKSSRRRRSPTQPSSSTRKSSSSSKQSGERSGRKASSSGSQCAHDSGPPSYQFVSRDETFWSYYKYIARGENGPYFLLQDHVTPDEYFPRVIMHVEDPNSPREKDRSTRETTRRYVCLYPQCVGLFKRSADLERHLQQVHGAWGQIPRFYCDYRRCSRAATAANGGEGGGSPFGRKDHYRDHLREYHHEDLPKRDLTGGSSGGSGFSSGSRRRSSASTNTTISSSCSPNGMSSAVRLNLHRDWWRCTRCLARNYVNISGWTCATPDCRTSCELDRRRAREMIKS